MLSNSFCGIRLLLALSFLAMLAQSQTKTADYPLSNAIPNDCNTVIQASTFSGDCCSLNVTQGNGCVLNVVNGNCKITGQYWTLDFTSTFKTGGAKCPPSQFPDLPPAAYATKAPSGSTKSSGNPGLTVTGMAIVSTIAAGIVAIAL